MSGLPPQFGELTERFMVSVLKTEDEKSSVSSNLTLSAIMPRYCSVGKIWGSVASMKWFGSTIQNVKSATEQVSVHGRGYQKH